MLATLDRLLADDGVLFIGHADRLDVPGLPPRFAAAGEPGCFAYRKAARTGGSRSAFDSSRARPDPDADAAGAVAVGDGCRPPEPGTGSGRP